MESNQDIPVEKHPEDRAALPRKGAGACLREERERQGLSFEDILERTRLQPHILKALETENWDELPSPAFAKGFLQNYAKALGLDPSKILDRYADELPVRHSPLKPLTREAKRRGPGPILLIVGLLLICLLGFFLWSNGNHRPSRPPASGVQTPADVASPLTQDQAAGTETEPPPETVEPPAPAPAAEVGPPMETPETDLDQPAAPVAEPRPAEAEGAADTAAANARHTLKMDVVKRTWVKIFVDDKPPEERIYLPGEQKLWHAEKGFEMRIGNAGGIRLEYNGRALDPLGKEGQVIRLNLPAGYERRRQEG